MTATDAQRYVLKDFRGSSHRLLASWMRELPPGMRVLELGSGDCHVARLVRRSDLTWKGLESSIRCLPALIDVLDGGAIVDLDVMPNLPRGFQAVLAADSLEHLSDPGRMLRLIREALPPGAPLIVSVPNIANLYVRLNLLFGRLPYADRGLLDRSHRTFFTRAFLRRLLAEAGFRIDREAVSTIPLPLAWPRLPRWLLAPLALALAGATRLLPTLLGYQCLVLARRR
ncbi:MAG: class I SAM-dependent methyltransferase [Acidobacteria bacterium]|nr:class I SAM-dependent methyltransferase [Acidobacteriota bacterium]